MTDEQLIKGCIQNDRRCQNKLYEKYFPLMSSIVLRYCNNQTEVLHKLNGGYLKILQNIKKYNNQYAIATWIRNVMVNYLIDEYRKEKKYIAHVHVTAYEDFNVPVDYNIGESNIHEKDLRVMLSKLPDLTQKIFNLFAIDGYKHREISDYLGIPEGTSKWHVNDARKRLKGMLDQRMQAEKRVAKLK